MSKETLQHHGVKGMKWHDHKADNQDQNNNNSNSDNAGGAAGGEPSEDFLNNVMDAFDSTIKGINDDLKNIGQNLFKSLFGNSSNGKPHGSITSNKYGNDKGDPRNKAYKGPKPHGTISIHTRKKTKSEINNETKKQIKDFWKKAPDAKITDY
jgi:hypothetical protein